LTSEFNPVNVVKSQKVKNNSSTQMIFTYPYGYPQAEIKLEEGSFNVYQGDKKPKKFGIRYDAAKQWALAGGHFDKEIKARNQLNRLERDDTIYRKRKFLWNVKN